MEPIYYNATQPVSLWASARGKRGDSPGTRKTRAGAESESGTKLLATLIMNIPHEKFQLQRSDSGESLASARGKGGDLAGDIKTISPQ